MAKRKAKVGDTIIVDVGQGQTFTLEVFRGMIGVKGQAALGVVPKSPSELFVGAFGKKIKEQKL